MKNLDAYTQRDLQHCYQILARFVAEDITDSKMIMAELHKQFHKTQTINPTRRKKNMPPEHICPKCNSPMYPAKGLNPGSYVTVEGRQVLVCGNCRFSEIAK